MSRTVQSQVFTFDELEDSAKETAREWFRGSIESDELTDYDDWQTIAEILGVTFKTRSVQLMGGGRREEPLIYWSGFASQGDGASFEGSYAYAKGATRRIREHAPLDTRLHAIADDLQNAQRRTFYRLEARITRGAGSNFYSHSGTMSVDVWRTDDVECEIEEVTVRESMINFADWIYRQLEAQNDYLNSDENVDESILANGYEFDESGNIA